MLKHMLISLGSLMVAGAVHAAPVPYGPSAYKSFADSPFNGLTLGYFFLEDFEDGLFNTPGVTGVSNTPGTTLAVGGPGGNTDSVDGDDGNPNDGGSGGRSLGGSPNVVTGPAGFTFTFDALVLGFLPTHVGIVFTDGSPGRKSEFEAFDENGDSLGIIEGFAADGRFGDTTGEDHFLGMENATGISSFRIYNPNSINNMEVDHLQYGGPAPVPVPTSALLLMGGLGVLTVARRRASALRG
ncbi:MAG: VPLPA-CTERM sorting domain-containing protein [Pseudomonadota bacterium]